MNSRQPREENPAYLAKHRKDFTGRVFGRLTVLSMAPTPVGKNSRWNCLCECGKSLIVSSKNLPKQRSCGCLARERMGDLKRIHGATPKYGKHADGYDIWAGIVRRCEYPDDERYARYGGRGIQVCERWRIGEAGKHGYECFVADMGPRPSPKHSVDRIDNDGNYEPGNCRWATPTQQRRNRPDNHTVSFAGREMTLAEACELSGVNYNTAYSRLKRGWSADRILGAAP